MKTFNDKKQNNYKWAMAIDLDRCNGCGACAVACQAENNIPVVGEKDVAMGRNMQWLRIERYIEGEYPDVKVRFLPVMCQHCEVAPCESVCPVYATYHNPEGLNVQVYNRCIGTRFCGNNCPYSVRSFNWWDPSFSPAAENQLNPDVSVRARGIMEKCTFCIQRIRRGKDNAKDENRVVKDGDILPACAQTCPTGAITFGDINDPESRVREMAESRRAKRLFEDKGTRPSVYYLKGGSENVF
jgi:molybdopterin-containing oxidoreductase family iron-sulfur binding subunit